MLIFALYLAINKISLFNNYYNLFVTSEMLSSFGVLLGAFLGVFLLFSKNSFLRKVICIEMSSFFYENLLSINQEASFYWLITFALCLIFIEKFTRPISIKQRGNKC